MLKYLMIFVACSLLVGCTASQPAVPKPEWQDLLGDDANAAIEALHKLDSQIEVGMTEDQVLAVFPPGVLVKTVEADPGYSFRLVLNDELQYKLNVPYRNAVSDYWVRFGGDWKVVEHWIILPPLGRGAPKPLMW